MQRGLGSFHGAFKLRTQVPQAAPPHERLHQDMEAFIIKSKNIFIKTVRDSLFKIIQISR
ncbi:hypothetical protein BJP34_08000 [Moorena producens PAL-8-15-08-1]|uniref:Uncharacterized protein n=1 Tax=Moorena producens PAL-8-15-08-1 TaxID=1458985 RepID=A0A1D8TP68_9CYAN|nr:hypothetical protein BJP34_08000 [Moorena producens PAL-8-15-08-1]